MNKSMEGDNSFYFSKKTYAYFCAIGFYHNSYQERTYPVRVETMLLVLFQSSSYNVPGMVSQD